MNVDDLAADFPPLRTETARRHDLSEEETAVRRVGVPLEISLLGEFSLRQREQAIALETPSHQALLAYLVIHTQRVHSRQHLAFQFWPNSNEPQARTNLRGALYTIRQILPDADCFLAVDRQTVQWRDDAPCHVDVRDFQKSVTQSKKADSSAKQQTCLEQAISAYHGDFLPGFYDDWVLVTREKLRQQYLSSLEQLLLLAENQREYPTAISLARKLIHEDPLHEAAYRRLMRLHSLDDNIAGALRTYHACSARLQRDLDVEPSRATQEAYERLLNVPAPTTSLVPARLPLVAREEAWQTLQTTWKRCCRGQPGAVLLSGEAGIGKTRLAEELLDWAERQGIAVLTAVCYPSEKQLAYTPVAKWLRGDYMKSIIGRLDQQYLVECSRLLPELNSQYPNLPAHSPLRESWQRQHFFSTLAQTLLNARHPFLLFLDDLHWCDQNTLDFLLFLLNYDPQSKFLFLTTVRSEEITPGHNLIPWQQQLDRGDRITKIALQRLDVENSAELARHVLKQPLNPEQARRLYAETEGNPLFVVEMARAGPPSQADASLPGKVLAVLENRLDTLSLPALELAQLASVIGRSFTFNLLNHACTDDEESLVRSLDEMWQRRIVRERDAEAYDFGHDKIRQVAYESLSHTRRRQFHRRVWQALKLLHEHDLDPVSGQIAAHCEAAGNYQEAITYYQQAARVAQTIYANQDTRQYLQRAIDLFPQAEVNPKQQIACYEHLSAVLKNIGRFEQAEVALLPAITLAKDPWDLSRLYRSIARVRRLQHNYDQAHLTLDEAESALNQAPQTIAESWWKAWLDIQHNRLMLYYRANQVQEMAHLTEKMRPIVETYGTHIDTADFYQVLVQLGVRRERAILSDETLAYAQVAYEAVKGSDDFLMVAFSRFMLAFSHLFHGWYGDLDEAESHLLPVLDMAEEMGNVLLRTRCLNFLAMLYQRRGDRNRVASLLPKVIAVAKEGNLQEYIATAEANTAWLKWLEGDLAATKAHGQNALTIWRELPFVIPIQWAALWPLIDVALTQNEVAEAVSYAEKLLQPDLARLPDELTAVLQQAINAWEKVQPETTRIYLEQALQLAQTYNYL